MRLHGKKLQNATNEEAARQEVGNLNNKANLTSKTFVKGGLLPTLAKLMIVMWRLIEGQMEWVSMIIRIRVLDDSRYVQASIVSLPPTQLLSHLIELVIVYMDL